MKNELLAKKFCGVRVKLAAAVDGFKVNHKHVLLSHLSLRTFCNLDHYHVRFFPVSI